MTRFDHDASLQGVGRLRDCPGLVSHSFDPNPIERVAAPAIYWSRFDGMRGQALPGRKNQMSD